MSDRKIYDFSDKSHSIDGKIATFIGILAIGLFLYLAIMSVISKGKLGYIYGILGFTDLVLSISGTIIAAKSFGDEESLPFFKKLGLLLNLVILLIIVAIFIGGIFIIFM